jgi:hypothetical protein
MTYNTLRAWNSYVGGTLEVSEVKTQGRQLEEYVVANYPSGFDALSDYATKVSSEIMRPPDIRGGDVSAGAGTGTGTSATVNVAANASAFVNAGAVANVVVYANAAVATLAVIAAAAVVVAVVVVI